MTTFCRPVTSQARPKRGPHLRTPVVLQILAVSFSSLCDSVEGVARVRHFEPDVVGRQDLTRWGIDSRTRPVHELRLIQSRRLTWIPMAQYERGRLPGRVVLRLIPGEPQPVIERQPRCYFPGVLHEAFDVPIAVLAVDIVDRLIHGLVDA